MADTFLSESEQALYESIVDGLRRQGWGKYSAQAEAIGRIDAMRTKAAQANTGENMPANPQDSEGVQ